MKALKGIVIGVPVCSENVIKNRNLLNYNITMQ